MNLDQKANPLVDLTDAEFQNAVEVFEMLFQWDQEAKSRRVAAQVEAIELDSSSKEDEVYGKLTALRSSDEA